MKACDLRCDMAGILWLYLIIVAHTICYLTAIS